MGGVLVVNTVFKRVTWEEQEFFETLAIQGELRDVILKGASQSEILKLASDSGMTTMEESGKSKVLQGETTIQELHRVLVST